MNTIAHTQVLEALLARLRKLTPESQRRWGTLTPGEMLCHLADASDSVLGTRVPPGPKGTGVPRPVMKWYMLYSRLPWPRGVKTRPGVNPKKDGTRPGDFERDRTRAIDSLTALAAAPAERALNPIHFMAGPMSREDWFRWAYLHTNHHLRQFGL